MNKFLQNLFSRGLNGTILLNHNSFSYKGNWIGVHPNTTIDTFHVGDFSSAMYQITVEHDSNEKEIMQLSVVARPDRAVVSIFGRSSIHNELVDISVTVDESKCKIIASPKNTAYTGAKLVFHATYCKTIHQLTPPAIVADVSTEEADGINTFDSVDNTMDATNITFDKV